jgi:hypothetical protein
VVAGEYWGNFQKMRLIDKKRFNIYLSKKKQLQLWIESTQKLRPHKPVGWTGWFLTAAGLVISLIFSVK